MQTQKEVLTKIRNAVKKNDFIDVNWPEEIPEDKKGVDNFIWIGTPDGLIGNLNCHYEFIFHSDEPRKLSLEVHLDENRNQKMFENLNPQAPLKFDEWKRKDGRIVFIDTKAYLDINDKKIVTKSLQLLSKMHSEIGEKLKDCILSKSLPILASKGGKAVTEKHYSSRTSTEAKTMNTLHGKTQEKLRAQLRKSKKYDFVDYEYPFENLNYKIDLLAKLKDSELYEIYEVKPYLTAMECIRVSLGQLLFYKALLEKGLYKVGKIVIVGPSEITEFEKQYFDAMKLMFESTIKIDYLSIE